ncbi:MAG: SMR family transporter [Deltaproteobacteria bacterium]|nr:SMR family transporter [Deltaproteobacteria bacterium]
MVYLLIAISFSTLVSLILKYSETRRLNRLGVTSTNYFFGFLIALYLIWREGIFNFNPQLGEFKNSFLPVLQGQIPVFSENGSFFWAILAGIPGGVCYFFGFIFIQKSIKENGVSITSAFAKLGIFVPMAFSIFLWKEIPTLFQWVGIALAIIAIASVHYTEDLKQSLNSIKKSLILVFFVVGLSEFSNKFFQHYASTRFKSLFLFSVFFTAFLISGLFTLLQSRKITRKDILVGILVGIPNMFTSWFLIQSFNYMKAAVVFPLYSSMTIVMITLGGVALFGERLKKKEVIAIFLTICAIVITRISQ